MAILEELATFAREAQKRADQTPRNPPSSSKITPVSDSDDDRKSSDNDDSETEEFTNATETQASDEVSAVQTNDDSKPAVVQGGESSDGATEEKFSPEEEASLLAESDALKTLGNSLFGDQAYEEAILKYNAALEVCPVYLAKPRSVLHSNISACYAKQEKWKKCVDACNESLKLDPDYMKPLLRRAMANEKIGTWSSLQIAMDDLKHAQELKPARENQLAMARLEPKIAEAQKAETAEMIGKLKELGNGILKPFGLSTDMFKMQPDGKGGYSMNFSK
ncbi:hypothetical protein BZA70DRAFT_42022 [Myxozyma melibiosi]|uniref:Uncharacterized protein n=1 Tax=Myxozyma melibiosi TaxID=54550 RepID=A0ABR1FEJ5_9ASCO